MTANRGGADETVLGILLPEGEAEDLVAPVRAALAACGAGPVEVRTIFWSDTRNARQAKAHGTRSDRWLRGHERPLSDEQRDALAGVDVLLALDLPMDVATLAPKLRFVQCPAAGVGQVVRVLRGSGIRLSSAAGLSAGKVAEFALARIFGVWADLRRLDALQRARRWAPDDVDTTPIGGRSLLVVGTGGIGSAVARRAAAFDVRVVGVRRRPALGAPEGFERVAGPESLPALLGDADAVVVAAPATERTTGLIGAAELAAMKPGALLCNVARGSLVDEDAVVAALESGHLGAAVLDVMAHEPLSRRSRLWAAPRAYLSPHVANAWRPDYVAAVLALLAENVGRDRRGEPLRNEVDLDEGY